MTITLVFFFSTLAIFELLKERAKDVSEGKYDFAACSVKMGVCEQSLSLIESLKGRDASLGLPIESVKLIQSRLICLCNEEEQVCAAVGAPESAVEGQESNENQVFSFVDALLYRIFVVPFQVSVWHFMYAETESVEGVKTLPFARRVFGDSLNMPEAVYQKYGSIYSDGDKTSTSSAPTSFIWSYSAYLGWKGFFLALVCVLGLDLVLTSLARFAGMSLTPILIGIVMILSVNFLASDFVTVLLSHGGIAGIILILAYALHMKKWKVFSRA